jgi:hypothetical protein
MALRGDPGDDTDDDGVIDVPGTGVLYEGPIEMRLRYLHRHPGQFQLRGRDDPGPAVRALRLRRAE